MARTNIVRAFLLCYNKNNKEVYNLYRNNYTNNYPYEMPYGYAPTYNAPQPVPQQAPSMNTNKIFVNGIDDVRSRIVPPNSDFMFLDNDKPLIYQKIVDAKGQFEVKVFDIVPHKDAPVSEFAQQHPEGVYLIRMEGHLSTLVNGVIYDLWDCSYETLTDVWRVERRVE